jgi:cobalamin-dependent methionine synthase I
MREDPSILSSFFRPSRAARCSFPRQNKDGGLCIADFFRDVA